MVPADPTLIAKFQEAVLQDDLEALKALLAQGLAVNASTPETGPLLQNALSNRRDRLAIYLLEQGASLEGVQILNSYSPLAWACIINQTELAKALIKAGASVKEADKQGQTPLHWAAQEGNLELVRWLVTRGADLNAHRGYITPPVLNAVSQGHSEVVRYLAEAGAKLNCLDSYRNTLLHLAISADAPEILRFLLRQPHTLEAQNKAGQSPLYLAAVLGKTDCLKLLLQAGARLKLQDAQKQPVMVAVAGSGSVECFNLLLAAGAKFDKAEQEAALSLAISCLRLEMIERLLPWFELSTPLSSSHPLMIAIEAKAWEVARRLVKRTGPDALWQGQSLLRWSLQNHNLELARLLLEAGARDGFEQAVAWIDNLMLLRQLGRIQLAEGSGKLDGGLLLALQKNIENLGFVLSPELAERVLSLSQAELQGFYTLLIHCLRTLVGAHQEFKPMYPHFPEQVKVLSEAELYLNAFLHYWGDLVGKRIMPQFASQQRPQLDEIVKLTPIALAGPDEALRLFGRLLQSRGPLRPEDKEDLKWFILSRGDQIAGALPQEVPFRENAALLAAALLRDSSLHQQAAGYLKNGLDVLRTATALSDGDLSLAENTRFISFSKPLRRWLLAQLENSPDLSEAFARQPEKFKRLGERLHPGDYKARFPKVWQAFSDLRKGLKPESFGRQLEMSLAAQQIDSALQLVRQRPGEFARRLDHLLRLSRLQSPQQTAAVLSAFGEIVERIPSALALQLMNHFKLRTEPAELRVFLPKGELAKLQAIENQLPELDSAACQRVVLLCRQALLKAYSSRSALGKAFVDPRLKTYSVPFALRSASKALKTLARGSRIAFGEHLPSEQEAMRFFIWWRDGKERTDLDLSALALGEDFSYQTTLAYYNLKDLGGYHSGDITSAPEGAAEFIDIELAAFLRRGVRYVMMVVHSFTTQAYCDLPECFAGFMLRQQPASGEIFEPRTLLNKFDLSANSTIAIPLILDLQTREVIWTDLSLKKNPSHANNVHNNRSSLSLLCQAMTQLRRPNLYELFELQIDARGERVYNQDQAETIFGLEQGIGPFDIPIILSDFI